MPTLGNRTVPSRVYAVPREVPASIRRPRATTRRVLVADPCPDTIKSAVWLLRAWGHDVLGAGNGPEALEVARDYQPDAILMEIGLPELDGFEVARRLRHQSTDSTVLLVAVTGYGDEQNRRRSMDAGFDCHFVKPVEPDVLQSLLAAIQSSEGKHETR